MFLRNLAAYSGASATAQFAALAQGFLIRRMLVPGLMGIWNYVGVAQGFVATFDLGITQAAARDLPMLRGAGEDQQERATRATAFWARIGQSAVFAGVLVVIGLAGWLGPGFPPVAIYTAAVLVVMQACTDSMTTFFQSAQQYRVLGRTIVTISVLSVIVVPGATWLAGLSGLFVSFIALAAVQAAVMMVQAGRTGVGVVRDFSWPAFRRLVAFGVPVRATDYPMALSLIADTLFVARFFPAAELALYATARVFFVAASDVPARMGTVVLSRLYTLSGARVDRGRLGEELARYLCALHLVVLPFLLTTAYLAANIVIRAFLPEYSGALPVAALLLLGTYFLPSTTLVRNFWIIDRRLLPMFAASLAGLVGMTACLWSAVSLGGWKLEWVATGTLAGLVLQAAILAGSVGREVWAARSLAGVAAWAVLGCAATALALGIIGGAPSEAAGAGTLAGLGLAWFWSQLALLPLYAFGMWRGRLLGLLSRLSA